MTPEEKVILKQERKQIKATLASIRVENTAIGKQLASMICLISSARASQLGIDVMITELEARLGK